MPKHQSMKIKNAGRFFSYVAKQFPVMCTSGNFPFMPPVVEASKWLDRLDDLSRKGIARHVAKLKLFKNDFIAAEAKATDSASKAQAKALSFCANGIITELNCTRAWEKEPELYLLIAFTGLHQAATMPAKSEKHRQKRFIKRLRSINSLLEQAPANIESISSSNRATAQTMIRDCARYLTELKGKEIGTFGKAPRYLEDTLFALRDFGKFIISRPEVAETEGLPFASMTEKMLGTGRTAQEIYSIAENEFNNRLKSLRELESDINKGSDWKTIQDSYEGPDCNGMEAMDAIVRETHRLRAFVLDSALPHVFKNMALTIHPQPVHLASVLRPIHYVPALGAWKDEPSRCYVSPQIFTGRGFRDNPAKLARIRRGFIFMTARQTYPGRHLLDSQRLTLGDSPLSQITNPLFKAGWLAFAEHLLEELGYLENPLDRIVLHQRGLSRAAMCMIDAGLAAGKLDQDQCLSILGDSGYSREESLEFIRAICLSPGSQVSSVLGLHEINKLRKDSNLELGPFCTALFAGGQVPFAFIGQQMKIADVSCPEA